ncbi:hypothetical protein CJ179_48035 [Rhodococcus sp. ACS1]|nr:hypothetical protein CJ179_48035 [Rhodococcus sp. ACS1]
MWSRSIPRDESVQVRQIVRGDGRHPGAQTVAVAAGQHLGKRGDVRVGDLEGLADGENLFESEPLVVGEVLGSGAASTR